MPKCRDAFDTVSSASYMVGPVRADTPQSRDLNALSIVIIGPGCSRSLS